VPVVTASGPGVCPASSFATTQTNLGPFYFIVPGQSETVTVTVTYNLAGGSTSNPVTATQTFSAQGPTGSLQPQAYLQTGSSGTIIPSATANPATMSMGNAPQQASTVGVWFKEPVSAPTNNPGSFIWIQILNSVDYSQIPTLNSNYSPPSNALNQLDGSYPYPSNADVAASQNPPSTSPSNYSADAPARLDLGGILGEAAVSFDATMYVLWDPAIPPQGQTSCTPATVNTNTGNNPYIVTPSNCSSIPVPLGAIDWTWSACAINALAPAGSGAHTNSWFVQCGAGTQSTYENSVYPTWNSCFKSKYGGC